MADSKRKAAANTAAPDAPTKRQRVSRACDQCRTAREKCDGIQPICFTCASSNRNCSYTVNPKKRGIPPGYIKSLEIALAWTFSNVPGSEDALHTMLSGSGQGLVTGKDTDSINKLHKRWRRSAICKDVDRLLSGSDAHSTSTGDIGSPDSGNDEQEPASGTSDIALLTPSSIIAVEKPPSAHSHLDFMDLQSDPSRTPKATELIRQPNDPKKKILPPNLWQLIDIYYAYTHCWLPIVEKQNVLKVAYSYPDDGLPVPLQGAGSGKHAELWSVLALASFQASFFEKDTDDSMGKPPKARSDHSPQMLHDVARSYIPSQSDKHEPGHVTSLLLLAVVEIGRQDFDTAWLLIGYAVRIKCLLSRSVQQRVRDDIRKKHVLLACFILDTFVSAHLGLHPHLRTTQLEEFFPVEEDGLDEWHAWVGIRGYASGTEDSRSPAHTISTFNRLATLAGKLNEATTSEQQYDRTHFVLELQQWHDNLPDSCSFASSAQRKPKISPTPPSLHLRMAYAYVSTYCMSDRRTLATQLPSALSVPKAVQEYLDMFGRATLPPIAGLYMAAPCNYEDVDRAASISNVSNRIWGKSKFLRNETNSFTSFQSRNKSESQALSPLLDMRAVGSTPDIFGSPTIRSQAERIPLQLISNIQIPSGLPPFHALPSPQPGLRAPFRSSIPSLASLATPHEPFTHSPTSIRTPFPPASTLHRPSSSSTHKFATIYDPTHPLDSYTKPPTATATASASASTSATADIDALFDELASLDGAEGSTATQPQFMQNLGFAPDVDLTDVLAGEYGQFDPFSVYMLQGGV